MQLHVSVTFASCGNVKIQVYVFPSGFRNGNVQKVVRFRCIRSNGNVSKRHETANGNTGYPSCFRIGFTCFCDVSVYGFLEFRPVKITAAKQTLQIDGAGFVSQILCKNCDSL